MADTSSQKRALWTGQSTNEPFLIAESPAMRQIRDMATRASGGDAKVLITGESGVGKDIIARLIHARSRRSPRPFVAVNCAAFSETLLESELFGHVKGSFTSAHRDRVGKLQQAHRGSIFLVEGARAVPLAGLVTSVYTFWDQTYPLLINRDVTRHDLRELVRRGLSTTCGNYRALVKLFGMPTKDYERFLNFLAAHDCRVDFREFRTGNDHVPPPWPSPPITDGVTPADQGGMDTATTTGTR